MAVGGRGAGAGESDKRGGREERRARFDTEQHTSDAEFKAGRTTEPPPRSLISRRFVCSLLACSFLHPFAQSRRAVVVECCMLLNAAMVQTR